MDYTTMTTDALEARKQEIVEQATEDKPMEELRGFEAEMKAINEELETRKATEAERRALASSIANSTEIEPTNVVEPEIRKEQTNMEVRNTKEYVDAYANYIVTGKDAELRALITENVENWTVAVPAFVDDIVRTAYESNGIISRIRKSEFKGNLKVNYEASGANAAKHTEGSGNVSEEALQLGIVNLIPYSYKKWVQVSDEALDMRGEAFLRYIYDEISYRIFKTIGDDLIGQIVTPATGSPAVATGSADALSAVLTGRSLISEEADGDAVVILNRTTWAAIESARLAANYAFDPFYGMPVIMSSAVADNKVIVGSLSRGAQLNLPSGLDINMKLDELTLATQDMNRVIGRLYAAIGVVAPNAFAVVTIA